MTRPDRDADQSEDADPTHPTTLATMAGRPIVLIDVMGTVALVVAVLAAVLAPSRGTELAYLAVSLVLFIGGSAAFVVGFLMAVGRSRTEVVDMAGLFYLTGTAPRVVRRVMLGLWFIQIGVVAVSLAAAPAFGVMALLWGIGLLPVWGARHGQFRALAVPDRPGRSHGPQ